MEIHTGSDHLREGRPAQAYTYDARGNITGVQDGNGNRTEFKLDEWGRIIEIHTPEGGVERYAYDYAGNITSTTDANGGTVTYRYNNQGQVCEIADQEGNSEYFYYDGEGRQETHVDRNGNVERTLYNMDGQLLYQRAEDKKGRNPVVNQYAYYPDGSLKEAVGGGITYRYKYTGMGLLKSKSTPGKRLLDYAYDKNQNVIRMTDLTGKGTAYAYDPLDRLERVEDTESGEALAAYRYTTTGRKESLRLGNGVQTKYRYGEDGSLSSLVTVTPEGEVLLNYDYAYDGNGNCTKKSGERYQNEYGYDSMGRLKEAAYNGRKEAYAYDLAGNRLKKETDDGTEFYSYNVKNQLLQMEKGGKATHYRYDLQGNMLEEAGYERKEYAYDSLNRQASVSVSVFGQTNRYDGEGLRYETEENGKATFYLFDRGELTAETDEGIVGRYARGHDVVYSEYAGEAGGYHIQDEAKNTLFILDRDHGIRKSYRYDAFGRILEESGELKNCITYTGQMYDGALGQYYLRARFYNPTIGRFLQEDVYRGDGLNLYAYCDNNPVMYYDPSGYMGLCVSNVGNGEGRGTGEITYPMEETHESARNRLMEELDKTGAFANGSIPLNGSLEKSYGYGKQIGRQSFDRKVRWRLDYDPDKGVHYNFEDFSRGKGSKATKIAIPIDINYEDYRSIIDWYNR